jgi:hypothetical protein
MARETRKITNQILEMIEEGILDPQVVVKACLCYMDEADVADMARAEDLISDDDEDDA